MFQKFKMVLLVALAGGVIVAACRQPQKMADQPYYEPLEGSDFFADGQASRHPPAGTVARGASERGGFLHTRSDGFSPLPALPPSLPGAEAEYP